MKNLIILIPILCFAQFSFAQVKLSGVIKDSKEAIKFASVVLKNADQTIQGHDITDEHGNFSIETTKGNYFLEVSFLGYQEVKQEINLNANTVLDNIIMESTSEQLNVVVVRSKIPMFERQPDRLIFNVTESLAARGGNALDALQVAPGLMVDHDAISILGKGVARVMLNGRMLELSGEELVSFLNSISSEDIQKIEIITNPPAKYEAAASGGLINIVFKKGVRDFWKASANFSNNKNKYNFSSLGGNFLYSKNKVNLNLSLNGKLGSKRIIETWETFYTDGNRETFIDEVSTEDNFSTRFALDYDLTEKTTVGVQFLGNFSNPDLKGTSTSSIFSPEYVLDSMYVSDAFRDRNRNSQVYNFHLVSKLDTLGRSVSFDLDYFTFENGMERNYIVTTYSPTNEFLNINQSATNFSLQAIDNYSAKIDFEHPLKSFNLSYGAKVSFTKTINDLENFNNISGSPVFDVASSNRFEYDENVQAIYLSGSSALSDKVQLQAGLRLENTKTKGFSVTLDETNENEYLKLFPTFYLSYTKDADNLFAINYGRRINRPWFRNLNPFRIYGNTNNYSEGYPFLQPSFSDNFEASYTHKQVLTTVAYFTKTTNGSGTIFSPNNETNVQAIIRRNFYDDYLFGIGEIYMFNKLPWWESQNQVYITAYKAVIDKTIIDATPKNGVRYFAATYNTFSLNSSIRLQVNFFYSSKQNRGLSSQGDRHGLDLGIRKNFLDKKLQLGLFAKDIFDKGSLNNSLSEVNGVPVNFGMNYSRRYLRFSMNYNFGNRKINVIERRFGNAEESGRAN